MHIIADLKKGVRSVKDASQFALVVGLHLITLLLLGLHLYVYTLPPTLTAIPETGSLEALWWGFWPITYLPGWSIVLFGAVVIGTIITPYLQAKTPTRPKLVQQWLWLIAALLLIAFFLFPIVHTRWGDAYILTHAIAWPDPTLRLTHSWQAPLDLFLHSQLWLAFHESFGWPTATPVYRLLSPIAGALYLLILLTLSRDERLAPNWLTFGLLASLGMIQLFFGYVENYSFAAVGILAYLWLGMGLLRGERPLWLASLVLALTHATHPSTIILAPSLLYCGWQTTARAGSGGMRSIGATVLQIALPMLLVSGATVFLMESGGHGVQTLFTTDRPGGSDARWFVPLLETQTRWEHYTLFSWPHLRDFSNQQMLVAPVVLVTLLLLGWHLFFYRIAPQKTGSSLKKSSLKKSSLKKSSLKKLSLKKSSSTPLLLEPSHVGFLLIASLSYLLLTWVWNPDYGGQRDWDLFSLAALPTTLLLIYLLPRALPDSRMLKAGMIPLILLQIFHTIAWLYQNRLPWAWPE